MVNKIVQILYGIFIKPFLSIVIGVRYENKQVLKAKEQYIIVANHNSHLDALSIISALPGSKLANTFTVAAVDYFGRNSLFRKVVRFFFNAIFIKRNRQVGDPSAIEQLDAYLKNGKSLILFPEGSRGKPGVLSDFKKGIAVLLKRNPNIHFIPAHLNGFGRVMPKDSNLVLPMLSKVRFGNPIKVGAQKMEDILSIVKDSILKLKPIGEKNLNKF